MCHRAHLLAIVGLVTATVLATGARAQQPEAILQRAAVQGGFVVVVGGDAELLAGLHERGAFTVIGLEMEPARTASVREHLRRQGVHGAVTAMRWNGRELPFTAGLVNLLVILDGRLPLTSEEVNRVLVPGGVAVNAGGQALETRVRPPSGERDNWTHYLYDASGNAVSKDKMVAPPKGLQWWAGPYSSRSHNWCPSTASMVSAGGRLFYLRDEGPIAAMAHKGTGMNWASKPTAAPEMPDEWAVISRDAFNGRELWRRSLTGFGQMLFEDPGYGPTVWNIWSLPLSIKRRMVATPSRVYVTLQYRGGLSGLDAATGRTLWDYDPPEGASVDEVIHDRGTVFMRIRREIPRKSDVPFGRQAVDKPWSRVLGPKQYDRYVESQPPEMVAAVDGETGAQLWCTDSPRVGVETLCALDGAVVYYDGSHVVCREAGNGKERWRRPAQRYAREGAYHNQSYYVSGGMGFLFCWNGHAYFAGGEGTTCYDLASGDIVWQDKGIRHGMGFGHPTALTVVGGKLIASEPWVGARDALTGRDLGRVTMEGPWGGTHGRCHRGLATERFLMKHAFGIEFYDMATGEMVSDDRWLRSECAEGYLAANGLLYHAPDPCSCWLGGRIRGYEALSPSAPDIDHERVVESERLEKGAAYEQADGTSPPAGALAAQAEDWPMYRHDALRSGQAACSVPRKLEIAWQTDLESPYDWRGHNIVSGLTPPVIAEGGVFVSRKDANEVVCLEVESGRVAWRYLTPALVDSPPAVHEGKVFFGCRDGYVYCLRAHDGALVWRFRAAPAEMFTLYEGRPGSKWPVSGAVLVQDGAIYCAAGHSSFLDGGIHFFKLDPGSGRLLGRARTEGPRYPFHEQNPFLEVEKDKHGRLNRNPAGYFPEYVDIEGARADILVSDGVDVRMGQTRITPDMKISSILHEQAAGAPVGRRWLRPLHLFLDDTHFHRAGWVYLDTYHGGGNVAGAANAGKMLAFDDARTWSAQHEGSDAGRYPNHLLGEGTVINADAQETGNERRGFDMRRKDKPLWSTRIPLVVRAMLLARGREDSGKILLVAGTIEKQPGEPGQIAPYRGLGPGRLYVLSAADGRTLGELDLDAAPVWDGMAAAAGRLFISLNDGRLICLGSPNPQ